MRDTEKFIEAGRVAMAEVGPEAVAAFNALIADQRENLLNDAVPLAFASLETTRLRLELERHLQSKKLSLDAVVQTFGPTLSALGAQLGSVIETRLTRVPSSPTSPGPEAPKTSETT